MHLVNKVSSFLSVENPDLWLDYLKGLKNALEHHGVDKTVLSTITINPTDNIYAILLIGPSEKILGGIRLEIKSSTNQIPLEKIRNSFTKILQRKVSLQSLNHNPLAEVSGLWVAKEFKGMKLSEDLAKQAMVLAKKLKISTLVSLLPTHTLNCFLNLGYVVDPDLPKFAYPDDRYLSTVVWAQIDDFENSLHEKELSI